MKIASAAVSMASQHQQRQSLQVRERLEIWTGQRSPAPAAAPGSRVQVSDGARNRLDADRALSPEAIQESDTEVDPRLTLLRTLVEFMTGRSIETVRIEDFQGAAASSPIPTGQTPADTQPPAGFGVAYDSSSHYEESESLQFSAQGEIRTTDGKSVQFAVNFQLQRHYSEDLSVSLRMGDAVKKDPLVLDLPGSLASLTGIRFRFDLEGDGPAEGLSTLSGGLGYLALDANANGRIDNGLELFGPLSGDGFADLARLDDDLNGWIDEQDRAFGQLSIWRPDSTGQGGLQSLADAGVGALYLGRIATPFALRTATNESLGEVRASGVYLMASGQAASLRQIDLRV